MNGRNPKMLAAGVIRYSLLHGGQALGRSESSRTDLGHRVRNRNITDALGISKDSVINAYNDLKIYMDGPRISS